MTYKQPDNVGWLPVTQVLAATARVLAVTKRRFRTTLPKIVFHPDLLREDSIHSDNKLDFAAQSDDLDPKIRDLPI